VGVCVGVGVCVCVGGWSELRGRKLGGGAST